MHAPHRIILFASVPVVVILLALASMRLLTANLVQEDRAGFIRARMGLAANQCPTISQNILFLTDLLGARQVPHNVAFDANGIDGVTVTDAILLSTAMLEVMADCADISFSPVGEMPWTSETFAVPAVTQATGTDSGFYAYEEADMLRLSDVRLIGQRVGPAPLGPPNYWLYPVNGIQHTAKGQIIIANASFRPCVNSVGSMHPCTPGEISGAAVSLNGNYVWNTLNNARQWIVSTGGSPPIAQYAPDPAIDFNGMVRIRGTSVQRYNSSGVWITLSELPRSGGAIVRHQGMLVVLSLDGQQMYRSTDAMTWETLTVAGIDFPVRKLSLLSKNGHLWIAGRKTGEAKDRLYVWPPLSEQRDDAFFLGALSERTVNLDALACPDADGPLEWRLPNVTEFAELRPAIQELYGSLSNPLFRVAPTSTLSYPVMHLVNGSVQASSNSDNMFCIADTPPEDVLPPAPRPACETTVFADGVVRGEVRMQPAGSPYAVRMRDNCLLRSAGGIFGVTPDCTGAFCFARIVHCNGDAVVEQVGPCPGGCTEGRCATP